MELNNANNILKFRRPIYKNGRFIEFQYSEIGKFTEMGSTENITFGKWEQCTNKKDKNNVIIYENDLIKTSFNVYGIVKFGEFDAPDLGGKNANLGFYIEWQTKEILLRQNFNYWVQENNPQKIEVVKNNR